MQAHDGKARASRTILRRAVAYGVLCVTVVLIILSWTHAQHRRLGLPISIEFDGYTNSMVRIVIRNRSPLALFLWGQACAEGTNINGRFFRQRYHVDQRRLGVSASEILIIPVPI